MSYNDYNTVPALPYVCQASGPEGNYTGFQDDSNSLHHAEPACAHRRSMAVIDQRHELIAAILFFMNLRKDAQDEF